MQAQDLSFFPSGFYSNIFELSHNIPTIQTKRSINISRTITRFAGIIIRFVARIDNLRRSLRIATLYRRFIIIAFREAQFQRQRVAIIHRQAKRHLRYIVGHRVIPLHRRQINMAQRLRSYNARRTFDNRIYCRRKHNRRAEIITDTRTRNINRR